MSQIETFYEVMRRQGITRRSFMAVLATPIVKHASVKPAAFRMAGFVVVDAAGAVVRFFLLHYRLFSCVSARG